MKRGRAFQATPAHAQQTQRDTDAMQVLSELVDTPRAAVLTHYASVKSFLKWADAKRVPRFRRGRICLWRPSVLLAFLEQREWTERLPHARSLRVVGSSRTGKSLSGKTLSGGPR